MIPEAGWVTGLVVAFSAGAVVGGSATYKISELRFRKKVTSILRIARAREETILKVLQDSQKVKKAPEKPLVVVPGPYSGC